MVNKVGLAWWVQWDTAHRASLRTFTAKKKRTPNLERRPSIMHYPIGAASRVDSSYQYPWLAACLRCYLAGRSIVVVVRLFAAFKVQLDQVFRCCPYIHVLLLLHLYGGDCFSLYKAGTAYVCRGQWLFFLYTTGITLFSLFTRGHLPS